MHYFSDAVGPAAKFLKHEINLQLLAVFAYDAGIIDEFAKKCVNDFSFKCDAVFAFTGNTD